MYNPIAAEAMARALHAERLSQADAARRARSAGRIRRRRQVEVRVCTEELPTW